MSVTTAGAIRDLLIARIAAQVPAIESKVRYVAHREEVDFRQWAQAKPDAAMRRFSVETMGDTTDPEVSSTVLERVTETFEIVIAYPNDARHRNRLGLNDTIASDLRIITYYAGTNGCSVQPLTVGNDATVISGAHRREEYPAVTFGVIPLLVTYQRSAP